MNKQYFKIISLNHTRMTELERHGDFNEEYHQKYIGQIGYVIGHYVSDKNIFKDFKCLITKTDEIGRPLDGDWFHKDDLEEAERKEEMLIWQGSN